MHAHGGMSALRMSAANVDQALFLKEKALEMVIGQGLLEWIPIEAGCWRRCYEGPGLKIDYAILYSNHCEEARAPDEFHELDIEAGGRTVLSVDWVPSETP